MKKHAERCWHPAPDKPYVDRTAALWAARADTLNNEKQSGKSDVDLTPGRKRYAGMP
jgi:hypothetical protein